MAVSYKGLTIKFGGDTTELQKALKTIQGETRKTNSDLREINKSLKFNPGNTELLAQKVRALNKAYEETKAKLDAYKQAMEQLEAKKERGEKLTEEEQRQYDSLERSILQCKNQLDSYEEQLEDTSTELEASKTKLYELGRALEDNADKLKDTGEKMEKIGTAMLTVSTAIAGGSLAAFNEVDAGMDAVIKKTGATGDAAAELGENVKNVATTVAGASNDWESLGNTVGEVSTRFGFTGKDLDDCSERFLQFAEITGTDATSAVQLVSRAMGDAGIEASDYSSVLDALAAASQNSGIEVDKLAGLLTSYGAPMRALGFDTESAIAIFSQWELAGVNTETAFSGMKKAISNWSKEGKDAREEFGKTLQEIANCPDIASATTKAIEVFGAKAGPDLADAIQGGRFEYENFLDVLEGSQGTVENTFNETVDGVDQVKVAEKELQTAGAELGEAFSDVLGPMMQDLASILHEVAAAFAEMSPEQKEFIVKATLMTGAAGGLTIGLGKVFQSAGEIGKGFQGAAKVWGTVRTKLADVGGVSGAFAALSGKVGGLASTIGGTLSGAWTGFTGLIAAHPIALGIAVVAAAIAGLTWFFTQTETGKQLWADFTGWITEKWEAVKEFFSGIPDWWSGICDSWTQTQENNRQAMADLWQGLQDDAAAMKEVLSREWDSMKESASTAWNNTKTAISNTWNGIKDNTNAKANEIRTSIATWNENVRTNISEKWSSIKSNVSEKVQGMKDAIRDKLNAAKDTVTSIFDNIKRAITDKINAAKDAVRNAIDRIKGMFNFSWSLPHLSLPHISISGGFSINPPRVPSFGISWYGKGGAIEPNNPHLIGVGDSHEREWIEPESKLLSIIRDAMSGIAGGPSSVNVEVNVSATVTGRQSAYELGQNIGRGISSTMKQRGYSYA